MKDRKPSPGLEQGPSRSQSMERPDNGARSSRGCGPSSGARKDNPHQRIKLARHGWLEPS